MVAVELIGVSKSYDKGRFAVKDVNLKIDDHDFVVLVGPSGCGKTTLLNLIAGLVDITSGDLLIDGVLTNDVKPKDRNIAMVFQNYALYPHMSVYDNLAFPLKNRKYPKAIIKEKVETAAKKLVIDDILFKKPGQLSGGQKQRVAIGRAIVRDPALFLMDEPLSNLDTALRNQLRLELIELHCSMNATIIYVTHDQIEALTLATKIVVMSEGKIQQIGSPSEIFNNPINEFVARFIGSPQINLYPSCEVRRDPLSNEDYISFFNMKLILDNSESIEGTIVDVGIRPSDIAIVNENISGKIKASVEYIEFLGSECIYHCKNQAVVSSHEKIVVSNQHIGSPYGVKFVYLRPNCEKIHVFSAATKEKIDARVIDLIESCE